MNYYPLLIASMIGNIVLLFCLFQPNIVYMLHRQFFYWRSDTEEYKKIQKIKDDAEKKLIQIKNQEHENKS